jgi:nicotinic acid mononucleotide adenylyltransferase
MKEIIWDGESVRSPYLGDMSNFHDWKLVSHIRIGYDDFEWVAFKGRNLKGMVFHSPSSHGDTEIWPEDIWGLRFKEPRNMNISDIHKELLANPSSVFVQTKDGMLIPFREWTGLPLYSQLHVYAGSFNPLHDGHKAIYKNMPVGNYSNDGGYCSFSGIVHAGRVIGTSLFELSINRFDKPPVSVQELEQRLSQFVGYAPVLITNVAKFSEKAGVLRGNYRVVFHVGADTIARLLNHSSVQEIAGMNCEFVYYKRIMNGTNIALPENMPYNCRKGAEIPEKLMRMSSTAIRNSLSQSK